MASDAIFAQLQLGISFDKHKWKKQMELFERPAGQQVASALPQQTAAAAAADPAGADEPAPGEGRRKKKLKTKHAAAAAAAAADEGGISLFSRQAAGGQGVDAVAAFVDREAEVQTRDPYEQANVVRKAHRIKVSGSAPPAPLRSFAELDAKPGCSRRLLSNMASSGFTDPTPIQRQAATALLAGRELLAVAPTGSGKTLAFLLPLVMRVRALKQAEEKAAAAALAEGDGREEEEEEEEGREAAAPAQAEEAAEKREAGGGVKAVVVSPTKELSIQTARVLKLLLPGLRLRCSVLSKSTAAGTDFSKVDVLLAQPLRLGAMAEEGKIDLSGVRLLVLDEADKLFEMGFTEQVDAVIAACSHRDVVRALFSATLPEAVEGLARSVLQEPLRITVGERNTAASTVAQRLLFVGREEGKLLALRQLIGQGLRPPVLVFVSTKERAKELHRELMYDGVHVDSIHADQSQAARQAAVDNFRLGRTWVLLATDLIGRGMDFLGVNTVVNFDFPRSTTDYIHRVGRTGRAGRSGEAVTFFMEEDAGRLRGIANVMRAAGCEVPDWMLTLKKERHHSKRKVPEADALGSEPAAKGGEQRQRKGGKRQGGAAGGKRQSKGGKFTQLQQKPARKAKGGER